MAQMGVFILNGGGLFCLSYHIFILEANFYLYKIHRIPYSKPFRVDITWDAQQEAPAEQTLELLKLIMVLFQGIHIPMF